MAAPNGLIVAWPSTAASIPSGWSRYTALDDKVPRPASSGITGTGGSDTHTHPTSSHTHSDTHAHVGNSNTATSASTTAGTTQVGGNNSAHTITLANATGLTSGAASGTSNSQSSLTFPRYSVIWIQSNGTTDIPVGAVAWTNQTTMPTGWSAHAASNGYYLRGATGGGNGGTATAAGTHQHTYSHQHTHSGGAHTHAGSGTSSNVTAFADFTAGGSTGVAPAEAHQHPVSGATASASHGTQNAVADNAVSDAPTGDLYFYQLQHVSATSAVPAPGGIIALWTNTTPPSGWVACNGSNGTPNINGQGRFIKGSSSGGIGATGGPSVNNHNHSSNHGHTADGTAGTTHGAGTIALAADPSLATFAYGGAGIGTVAAAHTHAGATSGVRNGALQSGIVSYSNTDASPAYVDMHFIMASLLVTISGTSRLVLPFPVMSSAGRQRNFGQSILTLPFPVLKAQGRKLAFDFPKTPLIDNFSGGNDTDIDNRVAVPSGRVWDTPVPTMITNTPDPLRIISGAELSGTSLFSSGLISGIEDRTIQPVEFYFFVDLMGAIGFWFITTGGTVATTNGYAISVSGTDVTVLRIVNGSFVGLVSVSITSFPGDSVGIRHDPDGTIHVYHQHFVGTGYYEIATIVDNSTFSGQFGFLLNDNSSILNFGGGSPGALATSRLILPFPVMASSGKQRDMGTSRLITPFPVLATNGRQAFKSTSILTLPTPVMAAAGLEKDLGTSRLIVPFPVMYSQGLHTDIQGVARLILPFPVMKSIGAMEGGARAYLILPSPIMSAVGRQRDFGTARLILPFPVISTSGRQALKAQARLILPFPLLTASGALIPPPSALARLILPFPIMTSSGRSAFKGQAPLILPFPILVSSGRSVFKGQARLILPSPLMHSLGRSTFEGQSTLIAPFPMLISAGHIPISSRVYLILPFPILQTFGFTISPPGIYYNPVIELDQYTGVLTLDAYSAEIILPLYTGQVDIPDYSALTQYPSESEVRSY